MSNRIEKNSTYYHKFGKLFKEVSNNSGFLNLGCQFAGQKLSSPAEAQRQLVLKVAELGEFNSGQRILDVGCGIGGGAQLVAERTQAHVMGIDPVVHHLSDHHQWLKTIEGRNQIVLSCGDALYLPFLQATFDRIYSIESAFHYPDKARFLYETKRVLRQNGKLVIADILTSTRFSFPILSKLMSRAVAAASFFDQENYRTSASEAGLRLEAIIDISSEVSRTFPLWRRAYLAKTKSLRQNYSIPTLFVIWLALLVTPPIIRLIGLKYMILIFEPVS